MTSYAKNLIGDWETEQFEPLRQVAQAQYQTNWNKLTNDLNNLNEQLDRNFKNARIQHNNALSDTAKNSYLRLYNAEQDLANRGLTGSGLLNVYNTGNTEQLGKENNALLQNLMSANKANVEGGLSGLDTYARNATDLAGDLANDLAGITDAEGDNLRAYNDLVSSISESAANRSLKYSTDKNDEETDRLYQLITINDIMNSENTDDSAKFSELVTDAAVSPEQAERILSSYNYNKVNAKIEDNQRLLKKSKDNLEKYKNAKFINGLTGFTTLQSPNNPLAAIRGLGYGITKLNENNRTKKLNELNQELSKYTYEDLKNILGY